jgi:hypothetical protein
MNIAQAEIKIGKKKAYGINDKIPMMLMAYKQRPAKPLSTDPKGSRLTEEGSKSKLDQGSQGKGSKVGTRCESGENDLGKVMFSFFYQPKLLRLPAWGN